MGEGANRVNERANGEPRKMARELEGEITEIRSHLDRSLAELDRRRHELTDVKLQVRRHPAVVIAAGATVLALLGGMVYAIYLSRRQKPISKARRLRHAFAQMIEEPEKVAKPEPSVPGKILAAVGVTVATMLTKKLLERALDSFGREPPPAQPSMAH